MKALLSMGALCLLALALAVLLADMLLRAERWEKNEDEYEQSRKEDYEH